jgi:hypothetical protein
MLLFVHVGTLSLGPILLLLVLQLPELGVQSLATFLLKTI